MPIHPAAAGKELIPVPEPLPASVIDAHTHFDACGIDTPEATIAAMSRAASVGVTRVVTVGGDAAANRAAVAAAAWHPGVYAAVAMHPTEVGGFDDAARAELAELAAAPRVVAVGETGLDYYWDTTSKNAQREAFAWHIALAKRLDKPLMIHDRQAHEDILDVLRAEGAPDRVIFHCFSGDAAFALRLAEYGFYMSFAGTVTFTNAPGLAEAARAVPEELILVETDAPFLAPHPFRGRRNESFALPHTVRALAQIRQVDLKGICRAVTSNTERVYGISS